MFQTMLLNKVRYTKKNKFEFFTFIDTKIDSMKLLSEKKMGGKNVNNPEDRLSLTRVFSRGNDKRFEGLLTFKAPVSTMFYSWMSRNR